MRTVPVQARIRCIEAPLRRGAYRWAPSGASSLTPLRLSWNHSVPLETARGCRVTVPPHLRETMASLPDLFRSATMRVKLTSFAMLVAASALVGGQQNPYVGRWNITGTGPDTDKVYFLEVKQNGNELQGICLNRTAHATPLAWIRTEGNELVFQYGRGEGTADDPVRACGPIYRAHLENGKLIGQHTPAPCNLPARGANPAAAGRGAAPPPAPAAVPPAAAADAAHPAASAAAPRPINWVGVRQPVWPPSNANGKHTYGTPVVLVGPGTGMDVWGGQTPGTTEGWKIV